MAICGGQQSDVCYSEAKAWASCVESTYRYGVAKGAEIGRGPCASERAAFDQCAVPWRASVGPSVKLRGEHPGEPPSQCMPLACAYENCMLNTQWENDKCKGAIAHLKHCVLRLYGQEYVDFV